MKLPQFDSIIRQMEQQYKDITENPEVIKS